jgi:hypothetical protein
MSKKSKKVIEEPKQEKPIVQAKPKAKEKPKQVTVPEPVPEQPVVEPEPFDMQKEILFMKALVLDLSAQMAELIASRKPLRRPTANGKVQIKDKWTGKIYPSKNNAYQTLLKSGELDALVKQGIFGSEPEKNTFGWYALQKTLPDRFEVVQSADE